MTTGKYSNTCQNPRSRWAFEAIGEFSSVPKLDVSYEDAEKIAKSTIEYGNYCNGFRCEAANHIMQT
jgi:hypothetical protein